MRFHVSRNKLSTTRVKLLLQAMEYTWGKTNDELIKLYMMTSYWHLQFIHLKLIIPEHDLVLISVVVTGVLVLKHQVISSHDTDSILKKEKNNFRIILVALQAGIFQEN